MCRKIAGPIVCCLLLAWGVVAAPKKGESPTAFYMPSTVGDKSAFEMHFAGQLSGEYGLEVVEVQPMGSAASITVRRTERGEEVPPTSRILVSDGGVYRLGQGDFMYDTPFCDVRLPFKKGETWETKYDPKSDANSVIAYKFTSVAEEEVEVPAGKFRCLRIDCEIEQNGETRTLKNWYAAGYGLVRSIRKDKDGEDTVVLKSFTRGGK